MSLRGAVGDEAISGLQGDCHAPKRARNDKSISYAIFSHRRRGQKQLYRREQ